VDAVVLDVHHGGNGEDAVVVAGDLILCDEELLAVEEQYSLSPGIEYLISIDVVIYIAWTLQNQVAVDASFDRILLEKGCAA
jgi:hypothetical protein